MAARDEPTSNQSAWSVVEEFRKGNSDAVSQVHQRVERIITFSRYRIPRHVQEELRQEVLIQVWQGVNKKEFDRNRGFWGFVQTVTARRCIDWLRSQKPPATSELRLVDSGRNPLGKLLDRERASIAVEAIEQLSKDCRELIKLRIDQDKSYAEIASVVGKSEQALRAQMYRCIGKMRDRLAAVDKDDEAH